MAQEAKMPAGHQYMTIFVIFQACSVMILSTREKSKYLMLRKQAFAQAGKKPTILRADSAAEFQQR